MIFEVFAALCAAASLFLVGYVLLTLLGKFSQEECAATSFAISAPIFAVAALAFGYVPPLQGWAAGVFLVIAFLTAATIFVKKKMYVGLGQVSKECFLPAVIVCAFAILFVMLPYPSMSRGEVVPVSLDSQVRSFYHSAANDNYLPYRVAQFVINRLDPSKTPFVPPALGPWSIFDRTPLMGLISSFFLEAFGYTLPADFLWSLQPSQQGHSYLLFQMIATGLNSLLLVSACLFMKQLFGKNIAKISLAFLVLNPFLFLNTFYTWPKCFVGYFILLSFYYLVKRESYLLSGFLAGLGYLTHDLGAFYVAGCVVYSIFRARRSELLKFVTSLSLTVAPWIIITKIVLNHPGAFLYYPLSTTGLYPVMFEREALLQRFFSTPIATLIWIRVVNAFYLLLPTRLASFTWQPAIGNTLAPLVMHQLPGAIGLLIFPFAYFAVAKNLIRLKAEIMSFLAVPILLLVLYIGWPYSLATDLVALHFAETLIPLLVGFGVGVFSRFRRASFLIFILSAVIFYVMMVWSYSGSFSSLLLYPSESLYLGLFLSSYTTVTFMAIVRNKQW